MHMHWLQGYAVAMLGIDGLVAKKGVYAGDTISVDFEARLSSVIRALPQ
eukprot:SAG11_NODE_1403_length_5007_cov_3.825591_5_plen_49_part_00